MVGVAWGERKRTFRVAKPIAKRAPIERSRPPAPPSAPATFGKNPARRRGITRVPARPARPNAAGFRSHMPGFVRRDVKLPDRRLRLLCRRLLLRRARRFGLRKPKIGFRRRRRQLVRRRATALRRRLRRRLLRALRRRLGLALNIGEPSPRANPA